MTETYDPLPDQYVILEATCCRAWPVLAYTGMGRCGYCQQRPTLTGRTWKEREND